MLLYFIVSSIINNFLRNFIFFHIGFIINMANTYKIFAPFFWCWNINENFNFKFSNKEKQHILEFRILYRNASTFAHVMCAFQPLYKKLTVNVWCAFRVLPLLDWSRVFTRSVQTVPSHHQRFKLSKSKQSIVCVARTLPVIWRVKLAPECATDHGFLRIFSRDRGVLGEPENRQTWAEKIRTSTRISSTLSSPWGSRKPTPDCAVRNGSLSSFRNKCAQTSGRVHRALAEGTEDSS